MKTVASITAQTPHRSFLWLRVVALSGDRPPHAWLIDEANRRGYFGAFNANRPDAPVTDSLCAEALVVAMLMPQAEADARTWKLVVRMLQRGATDPLKLTRLARMERAERLLYWLVHQVPPEEVNEAVAQLKTLMPVPRGSLAVDYHFDPSRLIRRPATKDHLWRQKQS